MEVSRTTSLLLCIFFGYFGAHKFYERDTTMGIIYLLTFGLFGIGWIVDIFSIAAKPEYYDVEIKIKTNEKKNKKRPSVRTPESYRRVCPRCNSDRFHAYVEEKVWIKGKTKQQTSLNMNPLKPFTVFNTKEKVIRPDITYKETNFLCDDCGKIFK